MKAFILITILCTLFGATSCKSGNKTKTDETVLKYAKEIPTEVANKWRIQLKDSESGDSIFLRFNNTFFSLKDFGKEFYSNNHHLMFYFGKNGDSRNMFLVECKGKLVAGEFNLVDSTLQIFEDGMWSKADTTTFTAMTTEWEEYMVKMNSLFYKAFIVPNEDIDSLKKYTDIEKDIYLSFGLTNHNIKMLLSNVPYKKRSDTVGDPIPERDFDACTPCPEICP